MVRNNEVQRIPTQIYGLDKLLYGGLDIIKRPFTIVIRGGAGSESTLFGLQLLYGIALSLNEDERETPFVKPVKPCFVTSCHRKEDIETLMIDTFLSSCIYLMTKKIIEKSYCEKAEIGQEAHRQIEKVIVEKGGKKEVTIDLRDGTRVRKDGVKSDGETYIIIKPKTSSGYRSAKQREKLKHKNGKKTETIYYDPNDSKYLKGSSTYIGPQKK